MAKSADAFRTISEVADWLGVPTHVLRFWESKFPQVKPVKRAGGRRYYRPTDMMLLAGIRVLLHDDGVTIRGVQKVLREKGVKHVSGLADREVAIPEGQEPPAQEPPAQEPPAQEPPAQEPPKGDDPLSVVVEMTRPTPKPDVVVKLPDPGPPPAPTPAPSMTPPDHIAPETTLSDESQMALFGSEPVSVPEVSPDQPDTDTPLSAEAEEPQADTPHQAEVDDAGQELNQEDVPLPGPSPSGTASLRPLLTRLATTQGDEAANLRAALRTHKDQLSALRDRLSTQPSSDGTDGPA